jgi:hypothetical protein
MCGSDEAIWSKITSTWPPIRSESAGPLPLYGTWIIFVPVTDWKNSPARWLEVPVPAEAMVTLPGRALTSAMNSFTERAGIAWCTVSTSGTTDTSEVGARSFIGSKRIFG